ncbi:MAG: tRNA(Ile)(2)-agmatinylcytidine synthase [Candidatus Bathyarchaeia archaeon]
MIMQTLHIGIDDTDSPNKGCTTYVAALLVDRLRSIGAKFIDYPNLIRLNPNVPWKTRGNGALCLRVMCMDDAVDDVKEVVMDMVEENSDMEYKGTDPGIVFFTGKEIPEEIKNFSAKAITGIVDLKEALKLIKKFGVEAVGFKKARGIIGALAAVGETLRDDYTFEFIAYRKPENYGRKRRIDLQSVVEMDRATFPDTFNNVDPETGRILITPRGPDPILFGIRGETPEIVKKAFQMIRTLEPIERWIIFRTNHGTDAHLKRIESLSQIKPYNPVIAIGRVVSKPKIIPRRHVIFTIKDESTEVDCAAYEPTGNLRKVASKLIIGDVVEVYGGIRPPSHDRPVTINLEKLRVLKLAPLIVYRNPQCPNCGRRLESMGKDKGFRCEKCGFKHPKLSKIAVELKRDLSEGLYIAAPRSQRHLTKPLVRYGREKRNFTAELIPDWCYP